MTTAVRRELPQRRYGETFELRHAGHRSAFAITVGRYPNGDVGEVFVSGAKAGSEVDAVARDGAVLLSLALQFGIPLDTVRRAITRNGDGSASSIIGAVADKIAEAPLFEIREGPLPARPWLAANLDRSISSFSSPGDGNAKDDQE